MEATIYSAEGYNSLFNSLAGGGNPAPSSGSSLPFASILQSQQLASVSRQHTQHQGPPLQQTADANALTWQLPEMTQVGDDTTAVPPTLLLAAQRVVQQQRQQESLEPQDAGQDMGMFAQQPQAAGFEQSSLDATTPTLTQVTDAPAGVALEAARADVSVVLSTQGSATGDSVALVNQRSPAVLPSSGTEISVPSQTVTVPAPTASVDVAEQPVSVLSGAEGDGGPQPSWLRDQPPLGDSLGNQGETVRTQATGLSEQAARQINTAAASSGDDLALAAQTPAQPAARERSSELAVNPQTLSGDAQSRDARSDLNTVALRSSDEAAKVQSDGLPRPVERTQNPSSDEPESLTGTTPARGVEAAVVTAPRATPEARTAQSPVQADSTRDVQDSNTDAENTLKQAEQQQQRQHTQAAQERSGALQPTAELASMQPRNPVPQGAKRSHGGERVEPSVAADGSEGYHWLSEQIEVSEPAGAEAPTLLRAAEQATPSAAVVAASSNVANMAQRADSSALELAASARLSAEADPTAELSPQQQESLAQLEIDTPMRDSQWSQAFAYRVQFMAQQGIQRAQVQLNPTELGPMEITVDVVDDVAQVQIVAEQAATREAVEQAVPRLRELMAQSGFGETAVDLGYASDQADASGGSEQQLAAESDGGGRSAAENGDNDSGAEAAVEVSGVAEQRANAGGNPNGQLSFYV